MADRGYFWMDRRMSYLLKLAKDSDFLIGWELLPLTILIHEL
jgi:hypothetical protein